MNNNTYSNTYGSPVVRHGSLMLTADHLDHRNIGAVAVLEAADGTRVTGTLDAIQVTSEGKYVLVIAGEEFRCAATTPVTVTLSREQVSGKAASEALAEIADMVEELSRELAAGRVAA